MGTTDNLASAIPAAPSRSALAPLREPMFRSLWVAAVISYCGTWMQNVGTGWLMTQLTDSPFMVGMVLTAATLPVLLVMLPAGALADMIDRRRLLLVTQGWMVLASGTLGILTLTSCVSPGVLLLFTFLLGLGSVMNDPAWQAITPEMVSPENYVSAVALNSAGFNVARAVGPALGGLVIAAAGSGTAFLLNALSFFGVIFFLYHWRRTPTEPVQSGKVADSILEGFRHVRRSETVQSVLIRTGVFSLAATSLWALLPVVARPYGSSGYGMLVGFFGLGALAGAGVLPRIRSRFAVDGFVAAAIVIFSASTFAAGRVTGFLLHCAVMVVAGAAWIAILACLNVAAQTMSPAPLRARSLSFYLLVLQGGMALGSAFWGALASRIGIPSALTWAALALLLGLATIKRHRLTSEHLQLAPAVVRD